MPDSRSSAFRYDVEIDVRHESTHTMVLDLVGLRVRVLELGCGPGHMSKVLKERGCEVVGIEIDAEAAKYAAEHCDHVIVGDLDQLDLELELGDRRFDVIIAADVLEHLKEPEAALTALRPFLAPDGYLVASIPNVSHGSVRLALLAGAFPYTDTGLLDRTHLRFYTRESMTAMLAEGGFTAVHVDTVDIPVEATEVDYDRDGTPAELAELVARQPDALVYQFVCVAFPSRPPLAALPTLLARLNRERAALTAQVGELLLDHNELEALRPELEVARTELAARSFELVATREDLAAQKAAVERLGEVIAAAGETLAQTTEHLAATEKLAVRRQEEIERLTADKEAVDHLLWQASERAAGAESMLNEIYNSRLWRTASRYRSVMSALRRRRA